MSKVIWGTQMSIWYGIYIMFWMNLRARETNNFSYHCLLPSILDHQRPPSLLEKHQKPDVSRCFWRVLRSPSWSLQKVAPWLPWIRWGRSLDVAPLMVFIITDGLRLPMFHGHGARMPYSTSGAGGVHDLDRCWHPNDPKCVLFYSVFWSLLDEKNRNLTECEKTFFFKFIIYILVGFGTIIFTIHFWRV